MTIADNGINQKDWFINAYKELIAAEDSLYEFLKQSWYLLEAAPFKGGWHIEKIAECLEAVNRREIRKLLINIPPRSTKTNLISIGYPAWTWIHKPAERFLCGSHSVSISYEHSLKCRRLIESDWYQSSWGDQVKLRKDQNTKGHFENTQTGCRIAVSVNATNTLSRGGNVRILDDPNSEAHSAVERESALNWYKQVWSTRSNDLASDAEIIVQQRLHEQDISGDIISNDLDNDWVKVILPLEFEENRRCTISLGGETWTDPRAIEGEILCPERFPEREVKQLKVLLGSYGYAGKYQQRPTPATGGIFERDWFKPWTKTMLPPIDYVVQSWDTALESGEENCYSACSTWGVFNDEQNIPAIMLLSIWRGKVEYPELRAMAQRLYKDYRDTGAMTITADGKHSPDLVIVEAKVSGISLIQELLRTGLPIVRFDPTKYGDKEQRVRLITPLLENGRLYVPTKPPLFKELQDASTLLIENCLSFPKGDSRDLVDTMTQTLLRLQNGGWLIHSADPKVQENILRLKTRLY